MISQPAWPDCGFLAQVRVLSGRSLRGGFADRRLVAFGLLQPIVLLLLFSQVFRAVAELPGLREYDGYVNFLVPATLVTIALTAAMGSGAGLLGEIYSGFAGRLRCLPISLFAVLVARTIADSARLAVQLVITLGVSILLLEFRPAGGVPGVVAAALLTLFVGWCLSWVFVAVTTMVRRPETLQAVSFIVLFPLMFSSSAYMPIEAMPTWLRVLSTVNPVTYAVDATRALAFDRPWSSAVIAAVGISLVAAIAGAALAAKAVRR